MVVFFLIWTGFDGQVAAETFTFKVKVERETIFSGLLIGGATVEVVETDPLHGTRKVIGSATTGVTGEEEGIATLTGFPFRHYSVVVTAPGFQRNEVQVSPPPVGVGVKTLNIAMQPGVTGNQLTVDVQERVTPTGDPVVGATVAVLDPESNDIVGSAVTDENGVAEVTGLLAQTYLVVVTAPDFHRFETTITTPEDFSGRSMSVALQPQRCDEGPGHQVPKDYKTIQAAIDAAATGEVVCVAPGSYSEDLVIQDKTIRLQSIEGAKNTIVNGTGKSTVLRIKSSDATVQGFTLRGGTGYYGQGGGLYVKYRSPILRDLIITDNHINVTDDAAEGGGAFLFHTDARLDEIVITDNSAKSDQYARGGGLIFFWGTPTLTNGLIAGNQAIKSDGRSFAGGVDLYGTSTSVQALTNVVVVNNYATLGGGIFTNQGGDHQINNVTIFGNRADKAAGMYIGKLVSPSLVNVIIAENEATVEGGGLYAVGDDNHFSIKYSNVGGNTPENLVGNGDPFSSGDGNISVAPGFVGTSTTIFGPHGNAHLRPGSPGIDEGDPNIIDPDRSRSDMGAFGGSGALCLDADLGWQPLGTCEFDGFAPNVRDDGIINWRRLNGYRFNEESKLLTRVTDAFEPLSVAVSLPEITRNGGVRFRVPQTASGACSLTTGGEPEDIGLFAGRFSIQFTTNSATNESWQVFHDNMVKEAGRHNPDDIFTIERIDNRIRYRLGDKVIHQEALTSIADQQRSLRIACWIVEDGAQVADLEVFSRRSLKQDFISVVSGSDVIMMSQNMYLGAKTSNIGIPLFQIEIPSGPINESTLELLANAILNQVPGLAKEQWDLFKQTMFEDRIAAFADQVTIIQPHVIALQEVARFYTGEPDFFLGGVGNASELEADFLVELLEELENRGLIYNIAVQVMNSDIEVPVGNNAQNIELDVRLMDRDVILVRDGVVVLEEPKSGNFDAALGLNNKEEVKVALRNFVEQFGEVLLFFGIDFQVEAVDPLVDSLTIARGWASVVVEIAGKTIRFVTTHLDPIEGAAQAGELAEILMAQEPLPTITMCDFNTNALDPNAPIYNFLTGTLGLKDVWKLAEAAGTALGVVDGVNCCNDTDLQNQDPIQAGARQNLIFANNDPEFDAMSVGALTTDQQTKSNLRASVHLGVVAGISFFEEKQPTPADHIAKIHAEAQDVGYSCATRHGNVIFRYAYGAEDGDRDYIYFHPVGTGDKSSSCLDRDLTETSGRQSCVFFERSGRWSLDAGRPTEMDSLPETITQRIATGYDCENENLKVEPEVLLDECLAQYTCTKF